MTHDNEGTARLIKNIREQAKKVFEVNNSVNMLGTIDGNGIYIDAVEDRIPKGDFLFLQTGEILKDGDRILCVPVGGYYVVLGKVK